MLSQLEQLKKQLAEKACQLDLMTSLASLANEPGSIEHVVRRSLEIISRANNCVLGQFWIVRSDDNVLTCTDWYHSTIFLPDFSLNKTHAFVLVKFKFFFKYFNVAINIFFEFFNACGNEKYFTCISED